MKKIIAAIGFVGLVSFSCGGGSGKLSLGSYNQKAITAFNAVSEKMATDREIIFDHNLSKEENLKIIEGLNTTLDSCINLTTQLKYPDDAKDFHESILQLYHFEKDSIMPLLSKTQDFEPESDEWFAVWNEFDTRNKRVDAILKQMAKLQEELAEKANAKLR